MSEFKIPERAQRLLDENPSLGEELKAEAMQRVYDAADPEVRAETWRALREAAAEMETLTSDDVWARMTLRPEEPRLLGPIMLAAARRGWVVKVGRTVKSVLPQNHRRDIQVWRSLIVGVVDDGVELPDDVVLTDEVITVGRMTLHRISRGYGLVCSDCHCEIDGYVRGPHTASCSNRINNQSLLPGSEVFAAYEAEREEVPDGQAEPDRTEHARPADEDQQATGGDPVAAAHGAAGLVDGR